MPPKPGVHTRPDAFIHAMPAYIPSLRSAGLKWVSAYPENKRLGLPYISGLIILNDVDNGLPLAIMDCTWITAQRTGAASALSARYLARRDSHVLAMLGCGVQARTHLEALLACFPVKSVFAYDINPQAQQDYISAMGDRYGIEMIGVTDPRQAVEAADIIVTAGPIVKHPAPVIQPTWLKEGSCGLSIDFASYWTAESLALMDLISSDDLAQHRYYASIGYFSGLPEPTLELAHLIAGLSQGRTEERQRTLAINLGLALEDMAVAHEIYLRAVEMRIGIWLAL